MADLLRICIAGGPDAIVDESVPNVSKYTIPLVLPVDTFATLKQALSPGIDTALQPFGIGDHIICFATGETLCVPPKSGAIVVESIKLACVIPTTNQFWVENTGNTTIDVTNWYVCGRAGLCQQLGSMSGTFVPGTSSFANFAPGDTVLIDGTATAFDFDVNGDSISLWENNSDFADPANIRDFFQWLGGFQNGVTEAFLAEIWNSPIDQLFGEGPYYNSASTLEDVGVRFWSGTGERLAPPTTPPSELHGLTEDDTFILNPAPGVPPTGPSRPATATPLRAIHVHKERYLDCEYVMFTNNGTAAMPDWCVVEVPRSGGCAPDDSTDLTAAGVLPTTLVAQGYSEYNLEILTGIGPGESIDSAQFASFMNNLDKPDKGEGDTYNVWNLGLGTIQVTHPRIPSKVITLFQGDAVCLKCCNGAWRVQLV